MYKTQKEGLCRSYVVGYIETSQTSKAHSFTPSANGTEFNFSKPFLCMDVDGSNPAARNLSTKKLFQKQNSLLEIA